VLTVPRVLCSSEAAPPAPAGTIARTRGVGLLGCGTVGAGVARRLLASHPGLVRGIAVRHPDKPRDVAWEGYLEDPFAVVDDPAVGVVVECIGGLGLARELVLRAIARGKDVVTANEPLIAAEGTWLSAFAARTGATLRHSAAFAQSGDAVAAALAADVLAALAARGGAPDLHLRTNGNAKRAGVVQGALPSPRPA
jgi:predicted dinucleotide-utilizing enzyme